MGVLGVTRVGGRSGATERGAERQSARLTAPTRRCAAPAHRLGRVAPLTLRLRAAPASAGLLRQAGTPPLSSRLRCTAKGACWSSSPTRPTLVAPLLQELHHCKNPRLCLLELLSSFLLGALSNLTISILLSLKMAGRYNRTNYSSYLNDEPMPDATSEKEQGNEYFKQKKFAEAVECYSRILRFYLELNRFEEAENDCTEALNLDDRYVKAYSRRITARKGLGKLKEAMDDAEFAVSVDANNPELRKQYSEIKALLMEKMAKRSSVQAKHTISEFDKAGDRKNITSHAPSDPQKDSFMEVDLPGRAAAGIRELSGGVSKGGSGVSLKDNNMQQSRDAKQKPGPEISVQELASRAASRYISSTVKSVKTPKTAYDFEVSWRAISDDLTQQIQLLKIERSTTDVPGQSHNAVSGYLNGREVFQSWFGGADGGPEVPDEMGDEVASLKP
uniref:RNA polymerase II-associated protein 3 n=1 Tax=Aegilops tauschii TaxID=37682 RepID=M8D5E8_AEGTA